MSDIDGPAFWREPKVVGYWDMSPGVRPTTLIAMYDKPLWIFRVLMPLILGWRWKDNDPR